jgi:hypothetical protein
MNTLLDDDLFEALGLEKLPEDQREVILEQMGTTLMRAIVARLISMLNEEDQKAFETVLGASTDMDAVRVFFSEKIPNFHKIVNEEVATFKTEALAFYKALQ